MKVLIPWVDASALQNIARIILVDKNKNIIMPLICHTLRNTNTRIEVQQFTTYHEAVAGIEEKLW